MQISISRKFHFDAAHALYNYDGPCRNIHGHRYNLEVSVAGHSEESYTGILFDFKQLKKIVNESVVEPLDHALILSHVYAAQIRKCYDGNIYEMDVEPTAENLVLLFKNKIQALLPRGIHLIHMRLYETENCFAEWVE